MSFSEVQIAVECLLAVNAIDNTDEGCHIRLVRMTFCQFAVLVSCTKFLKEDSLQFCEVGRSQLFKVLNLTECSIVAMRSEVVDNTLFVGCPDKGIHATLYHFVLILNVNDKFLCLTLFLQQLHKVTQV